MKSTILIVDDDPQVRGVLVRLLSRKERRVLAADDGDQALDIIGREKPLLMLLDVCMPHMDGLEVLRSALEIQPDLAVVVISGLADTDKAKRMLDAGAKDYITKPIDFEYLESTVLTQWESPQGAFSWKTRS